MRLRNTTQSYGLVAILFHWGMAVAIIALFALGLWMVDLSYYDAWYRKGPDLHRAIGVLLFIAVMLRLIWRLAGQQPHPEPGHSPLERRLAKLAHGLMYGLLFATTIAGYLISTADGRPVEVFGLFSVPALPFSVENQEDIAGTIHFGLAVTLISLAGVHALGALKHHFIDRDRTLLRMLGHERPDDRINHPGEIT